MKTDTMTTVSNILFDLDGTLIDTAPDLAYALNEARGLRGMPPVEYGRIRQVVSLGGTAMIKLAFGLDRSDPDFPTVRDEFLAIYSENINNHSILFEGMEAVIDSLEKKQMKWGIVTNKPEWLTTPLLASMALDVRAACVVSGDTLPFMKPRPEPLLHACKQLECPPRDCVYIGDAKRDIEAGSLAGMATILATYGYIEEDADIHTWGATAMINNPGEILDWLGSGD